MNVDELAELAHEQGWTDPGDFPDGFTAEQVGHALAMNAGLWTPRPIPTTATPHLNGNTPGGDNPSSDLFQRWTTRDLLHAERSFEWLVKGFAVQPSYGMFAGQKKTLKTYVATIFDLAVATGEKLFGHFDVPNPGPVIAYMGEGGRIPFTTRLERIATAMGVTLSDADLHLTFDVAPIGSARFQESFRRDLDEIRPVLARIDPLYAYHGATTNAANLHEEGALLSSLSAPAIANGTSLYLNNHFSKGGGHRKDLDSITMAGGGEWVDTWVLLSHREPPQVEQGQFRLLLDIGSRQWGGRQWDLDIDVGRFDEDLAEFEGAITWDLNPHDPTKSPAKQDDAQHDRIAQRIYSVLADEPYQLTKTKVLELVGGNRQRSLTVFDDLATAGTINHQVTSKVVNGRTTERPRWAMTPDHSGTTENAEE